VLHEFAYAGHNDDVSLAEELVKTWGVSIDGPWPSGATEIETPFALAVLHNAFKLADAMLALGADLNALSVRSTFLVVIWPVTILGHLIISNARHSVAQLRYLLSKENVRFVVEPERGITALHRAAWAGREVRVFSGEALRVEDFNTSTNRSVVYELLKHFDSATCRDAKSHGLWGWAALHFTVDARNVQAVEAFIRYRA
jgi:hypothetical protein